MSFNRNRRLKNPTPVNGDCTSGSLVRVLSGRTRGKIMVLTGTFTDKSGKCFAYVADGGKYTVSKPKIKAASHLELLEGRICAVTDEEIRKSVSNQ